MIIAKLQGGLGNQMFQYAAARALAINKKQELLLDITSFDIVSENITTRHFELNCLNIKTGFATPAQIKKFENSSLIKKIINKVMPYYKRSIYFEPHFHFDNNFFKASSNTMLIGYWQSEKYFRSISTIIRNRFEITGALSGTTVEISKKLTDTNSVSIHVRRGDYVLNFETQRMHGSCNLDYYTKALEMITAKTQVTHLYIFSDDISWTRENLKLSLPATFVEHNNGQQAYEDLYLMSRCKHNIIANSSFSWWGAWLNNNSEKIVVAPKNWFNEFKADTKDLYPSNWIVV